MGKIYKSFEELMPKFTEKVKPVYKKDKWKDFKNITKEEFDNLPADIYFEWVEGHETAPSCPKCGNKDTHPRAGCGCPVGKHIMKYHHTC